MPTCEAALAAEDVELRATAAYLLGREDESLELLERDRAAAAG